MSLPIDGCVPIILRDHCTVGLQPTMLSANRLGHPEDRACYIEEILFVAKQNAGSDYYDDLSLAVEVDITLGRWHLTDGFIPVGLFDKVNPIEPTPAVFTFAQPSLGRLGFQGTTYKLWRLVTPLYVPQGSAFNVTVRRDITRAEDVEFSFVARGRSLPPRYAKPTKTQVPWVTKSVWTIPQFGGTWMGNADELKNKVDQAVQLDYMVGTWLDFGIDNCIARDPSLDATAPTLKLTSSAFDLGPVPSRLPFNTVFCPQTDKLWLGRPMGMGEHLVPDVIVSGGPYYYPKIGLSMVCRCIEEVE